MKTAIPFLDENVENVFNNFPEDARERLSTLRTLIFEVAAQTTGVGRLEETLKWGQPAYVTRDTKSGSTLRLGVTKQGCPAIYVHCQTTIMSDFQALFPDDFVYEGNRAIHLEPNDEQPLDGRLELLVKTALTYHLK